MTKILADPSETEQSLGSGRREAVFEIFLLSLADLVDSRILGTLARSLLVTLLIFLIIGIGLGWLLIDSDPCSLIGDYECVLGPSTSGIGALALTALALWFLFPAVALGVICAYVDRISAIIEERHYPLAAARARPLGLWGAAALGLRSALRVLLYNLLAMPLYVLLLVTGAGALIAFVFVNGLAFGHDLGEMVASRHGDRTTRRDWLRASHGGRLAIGSMVSAIFLVPFANLLAPVLGATMTTHLYHRLQRTKGVSTS